MNNLLSITTSEQGLPVVSTLDFAEGLEIQHKNLLETVRTYQLTIEKDFGQVAFQTETVTNSVGAVNQIKYALLTEDQALFVGSLSRNSERVVEFKSVLVRSFAEARRMLQLSAELPSYQINDPIQRAERWIQEEKERKALKQQTKELQPLADYTLSVLASDSELTSTVIAKELGKSAIWLNRKLQEQMVQFKQGDIWV